MVKPFLLHTQPAGVAYYRHYLPAKALKNAGHPSIYFTGASSAFEAIKMTSKSLNEWFSAECPNLSLIHSGYTTIESQLSFLVAVRNMALQLHGNSLPLIFDVDDDIINVPAYNVAFGAYTPEAEERKISLLCLRASDATTVSTPHLTKILRDEAKHLYVLPNYCNPSDWPEFCRDPRRSDDNSIRIMFAGNSGRLNDINEIETSIHSIMSKYDGKEGRPLARLFFLGCTPSWATQYMPSSLDPSANRCFYIRPTRTIETYWKIINYIQPDIFLAPVVPNEFNRSKSDIKAYDAAMSGAALICTDWTTYENIPNEACLKAWSPTQWTASLEALIEDPSLRKKLHKTLSDWVLDTRQIKDHIHKWQECYEEVRSRPVVSDISDIIRPRIARIEQGG